MSNFRIVDRLTKFLLPPSVDDWLPARHLARFVVEVVESLDLRSMTGGYRGSGSASYHPSMLLALLIYGYATGVFSSRKLERATYDSVAFRFIAGNDHPDHDTIATFRKRFLKEIEALFVRVLTLAKEMGLLQMGTVALDGTKIHANASRHSALSHEYASKLEAQLKQEVAELLAKAEAADAADLPDGLSIPEELALREGRLKKLAEARAKIEARAKERYVPGYLYRMSVTWQMPQNASAYDVAYWISSALTTTSDMELRSVVINTHAGPGALYVGGQNAPQSPTPAH